MARLLRIEYAGGVYHVTSRGDRRDHEIYSRLSGLTLYNSEPRRERSREENVVM